MSCKAAEKVGWLKTLKPISVQIRVNFVCALESTVRDFHTTHMIQFDVCKECKESQGRNKVSEMLEKCITDPLPV